jgi:hypothetical protein
MSEKAWRSTRIGEFTPLGFALGFALCFLAFWFIYHRLSFGTVPAEPPAQMVSVREMELLSARVKSNEQLITSLQKRVDCLELAVRQAQKRGADQMPKCE